MALHLSGDKEADALISRNSLALLIGMVLDQQITIEKAFSSPSGTPAPDGQRLNARTIADMDPEKLAELFKEFPALHRFPGSMSARVQAVCRTIVDDYGGKAENIWSDATSGKELIKRLTALPGFGAQKAAHLRRPLGQAAWRPARRLAGGHQAVRRAGLAPFGGRHHSTETLLKVRDQKRKMKAKAKAKAASHRVTSRANRGLPPLPVHP